MNPAIVMLLVPLFTLVIYPRLGKFASPLKRMSYGMFIAAASYLIVAALQKQIESGAHLCVLWQTVPYLVLTTAEVLFSTTGLEFAFREAAPEMKSAVMSFWLLDRGVWQPAGGHLHQNPLRQRPARGFRQHGPLPAIRRA